MLLLPDVKVCTDCFEIKCILAFVKDKRSSGGRRNQCHECHAAKYRERRGFRKEKQTLAEALKEASYKALEKMIRDDPELFVRACNLNAFRYKQYLKKERDKVRLIHQQSHQAMAQREQNKNFRKRAS